MDEVTVQCPYCFEQVEFLLDPDTEGELIRDCDVCCNPWLVQVRRQPDGGVSVEVDAAQ